MPTLVLMRHGESGFAARDRTRPLTSRGGEEAASQARVITRVAGGIDVATVSEVTRTRQTLVALRSARPAVVRVWEEASLYSRGGEGLLETLRGSDRCGIGGSVRESADAEGGVKAEVALAVGHEPMMSTLAGLLAIRENDLSESRGRTPFRVSRGSGAARVNSFRHSFFTVMAVVRHVKSWSSLAPGRMRIVDVLCPQIASTPFLDRSISW